jgi:hypothetical protein
MLESGSAGLTSSSVEELGALLDEAVQARDVLSAAAESGRLEAYDETLLNALDATASAAETALRARLTELTDAREAFIAEAASQLALSRRMMDESRAVYSYALPVVVG